jgi:hypothetical protein
MPKMKFFRQPAAIMQRKSLPPAEAKRRLKQQDALKENPCGAKTKKAGSAIVAGTKKLYFSVLALASAPACTVVNDKVEKTGWILVGSIVGIMLTTIGVHAIVEKIISRVKAKKENRKIEKEEPATNWSREID